MIRKFKNITIFLIIVLTLIQTSSSKEWEVIDDARIIPHPANDGDSFHALANGQKRIFRLYYVDTPETENNGYAKQRVKEQSNHFGISTEESMEIGRKAKDFTSKILSAPFSVLTRGENALGNSSIPREYAFITTAGGDDLGGLLLSYGLARSFGKSAAAPDTKTKNLWERYNAIENQAKRKALGAWKKSED